MAEPMPLSVACPKTAVKKPGETPTEDSDAVQGEAPLAEETLKRKFDKVPRPATVQLPAPMASKPLTVFCEHAGGRAKTGIQIAARHNTRILRIEISLEGSLRYIRRSPGRNTVTILV